MALTLSAFIMLQGQAGWADTISTDDEIKYSQKRALAELNAEEGNADRALMFIKQSTYIPHKSYGYELTIIFEMLRKKPQNPDGHIALGRTFLNYVSPSFDGQKGEDISKEAVCEFHAAKGLSFLGINREAEDGLMEIANFKKLPASETVERYPPVSFQEKLLAAKWQPPFSDDYLIMRVKGGPKNCPVLYTESCSKHYDQSVVKVLRECSSQYPFLWWSCDALYIAFMAHKDEKTVEAVYGSVLHPIAKVHKTDDLTDLTAILPNHLNADKINLYCCPETKNAYKIDDDNVIPDMSKSGSFKSGNVLPGGSWRIDSNVGKPEIYRLVVGQDWALSFFAKDFSTPQTFENAILKQRTRDILFSALLDWIKLNTANNSPREWNSRQPNYSSLTEHFDLDKKTGQSLYSCKLISGKMVNAVIAPDGKITNILVDGKADLLWLNAVKNILKDRKRF